jgi:hypothetical protein
MWLPRDGKFEEIDRFMHYKRWLWPPSNQTTYAETKETGGDERMLY